MGQLFRIPMGAKYQLTTEYKGITQFYFSKLLNTIIRIGDLERDNLNILDYGSGYGVIKKILNKRNKLVNVINFDIQPELTDISDWHNVDFNVVVANEVFYTFDPQELEELLQDFRKYNSKVEFVVGISKQSFLNNVGKVLFGKPDAHNLTKILPKDEIRILSKYLYILEHKSVWFLADVYRLKFKR